MENQELIKKMSGKKKFIAPLILLVVVVVAVIFLLNQKNQSALNLGPESKNYIPNSNTVNNNSNVNATSARQMMGSAATPAANLSEDAKLANLKGAKVAVVGANPITKQNIVVTETGNVTVNSSTPMSENAPRQTGFLKKEELPTNIVSLSVGNAKFSPNAFATQAGAPTTFSLTSVDDEVHVFAFDDASLSSIVILVGPKQTKAITFNAPAKNLRGYSFHCTAPGHAESGEVGIMSVR